MRPRFAAFLLFCLGSTCTWAISAFPALKDLELRPPAAVAEPSILLPILMTPDPDLCGMRSITIPPHNYLSGIWNHPFDFPSEN